MLNGLCSGICGGASFREERLTLAELGKMDVFKINDDDDDESLHTSFTTLIGVSGTALVSLTSYLTNRTQTVHLLCLWRATGLCPWTYSSLNVYTFHPSVE